MIKVGFICEGYTEKIFLESAGFGRLLQSLDIELLQVINAEGCDNLLPHNITPYTAILENAGAHFVIIVTDLDDDSCITETKNRISARDQDVVIVAVKKIEAWFLGCTPAMRKILGQPSFECPDPEDEQEPFEAINNLLIKHSGRGIGKKTAGKKKLINRLLGNGLDLSDAATHGNCPSAAYFLRKLQEIGKKVITSILLVFAGITILHAQTHKDSVLSTIRQNFQRINGDSSLRRVELEGDEFLEHQTDGGGGLTGYFKGDAICKMVVSIGVSFGMTQEEYYFDQGKLIEMKLKGKKLFGVIVTDKYIKDLVEDIASYTKPLRARLSK